MIVLLMLLSLNMFERLELYVIRLDVDTKLENKEYMHKDSLEIYEILNSVEVGSEEYYQMIELIHSKQ